MNGLVRVEDLNQIAGRAQLVDVRSISEYATGHLPGAINIPLEQLEARLEDLSPGSPIVLICQSGRRAQLAAGLLEPCRTDVRVLDGGTTAWVKAGFPVVVSARTRWALERQVRLIAGLIVVVGTALALGINRHWMYLAGFVGLGLTFAGLTDNCLMASVLCRMPWNRSRRLRSAVASTNQMCSLKTVASAETDGETISS